MATTVEKELQELKTLFSCTEAELADLAGVAVGSIASWKHHGRIPVNTRRLLIMTYRDAQYRKVEITADTKSYLDECRNILSTAQKKYGAIPNKEQLLEAAGQRFEKQSEKYLKEGGKEGQQFSEARKDLVVEKLADGANSLLQTFLKVNTEGAWPPVSRILSA